MSARVVPEKGYARGGEQASVTYLVGGYDLFPDVWEGFSLQFTGSESISYTEAERVDVRTFHFVVPDHGVVEIVSVTLTCSTYQLSAYDIPPFQFELVDGFSKISNFLPVNKTPLAVPLVVALGIQDDTTNYSAMDRAFIQFYREDTPTSLKIKSVLNDLRQLEDDENLLHICSDLGLHQFMAHICDQHPQASEALDATWKGRTPLDVARYRACMPESGCRAGHTEARNLLETLQDQVMYTAVPERRTSTSVPVRTLPLPPKPRPLHTLPRQPPAPEHSAHDTNPLPRQRLPSSATRYSEDSGVGIYTSVSVFSGAGLEVQKEKAIGVVRVTRSYRSDVEEGMLHLRVGDIVHILSHADDGKWYGVVGDEIGFFYMTFVDHDNISWQEHRQQSVDMPKAEVIRDSTPDRDDIGFLQVKVRDVVQVLAMPDSGLWTAEKDCRVGYVYSSDLQLLGDAIPGWDHAPAEDQWSGRMRTRSIYTIPHHVKFYGMAVKRNSLNAPNALHFKMGDRIGIIDCPSSSSGIWFGKLGRKSGKFLFSDVEVENYGGLEQTRQQSSDSTATKSRERISRTSATLPHSTGFVGNPAITDELRARTMPQRLHNVAGARSTPSLPPRGHDRIRGFAPEGAPLQRERAHQRFGNS